MKRFLIALFATTTLTAFVLKVVRLPIGADIPKADIKMKDVGGELVSLREAKTANGLLVMFISNTCPYVLKNQARAREICQYAQERKIGIVLLNSNEGGRTSGDSYREMQEYAKKQGFNWFYLLDSDNVIADAFGATRTPECFLFDKDGKLVYHGAIDDSPADITEVKRKHLREAIDEMINGKSITVTQSRSIGCAIRRKS